MPVPVQLPSQHSYQKTTILCHKVCIITAVYNTHQCNNCINTQCHHLSPWQHTEQHHSLDSLSQTHRHPGTPNPPNTMTMMVCHSTATSMPSILPWPLVIYL